MDEIDPHNLGPRVYKEDQVLTRDDLYYLETCYKLNEVNYMSLGRIEEAKECCIAHQVTAALQNWLDKGKPREDLGEEDTSGD